MELILIIIFSMMLGAYLAFVFVGRRIKEVLGVQGSIEFMKKFRG